MLRYLLAAKCAEVSPLLLGVRGAKRGVGDENLGFGWVDVLHFHGRLMLLSFVDANPQVIDLTGFGC